MSCGLPSSRSSFSSAAISSIGHLRGAQTVLGALEDDARLLGGAAGRLHRQRVGHAFAPRFLFGLQRSFVEGQLRQGIDEVALFLTEIGAVDDGDHFVLGDDIADAQRPRTLLPSGPVSRTVPSEITSPANGERTGPI